MKHIIFVTLLLIALAAPAAWSADSLPPQRHRESLGLTPASLQLRGAPGQGLTQSFRVVNNTSRPLTLRGDALDLLVREGKQVRVPAGELRGSLAGAITIAPREQRVEPGGVATFDVTFSVPLETDIRAVIVRFASVEGTDSGLPSVSLGLALGSLVTFTLSDDVEVEPLPLDVIPSTATRNLAFRQGLRNVGSEPFYAKGAVAILDQSGLLVGKLDIKGSCFLPGREAALDLEYPEQLPIGSYRALLTLQYREGVLTTEALFEIR